MGIFSSSEGKQHNLERHLISDEDLQKLHALQLLDHFGNLSAKSITKLKKQVENAKSLSESESSTISEETKAAEKASFEKRSALLKKKLKLIELNKRCFNPIDKIMQDCGYYGLLPGTNDFSAKSFAQQKKAIESLKRQPVHCSFSHQNIQGKLNTLLQDNVCQGSERFDILPEEKTIVHGKSSQVLRDIPFTKSLLIKIAEIRDQIVTRYQDKYAYTKQTRKVQQLTRLYMFVKEIHIDDNSSYIVYHPTPSVRIRYEWSSIRELKDLLAELRMIAKLF